MNKLKSVTFTGLLCAILMTGCGSSLEADTNTIYVEKNGKITSVDVEAFDQSYYDETELETFVDEAVNAYNEENGKGAVKVEELSVEDGVATLKMQYKTAEDYAGFNGIEMYQGSVVQAVAAGYGFDTDFVRVSDQTVAGNASKEEIYSQDDVKVVVIRAKNIDVKVDGEILFVSCENVELKGNNTISIQTGSWLGERPVEEEVVEVTETTEAIVEETETEEAISAEITVDSSVEPETEDDGSFETDVYTYIIYK